MLIFAGKRSLEICSKVFRVPRPYKEPKLPSAFKDGCRDGSYFPNHSPGSRPITGVPPSGSLSACPPSLSCAAQATGRSKRNTLNSRRISGAEENERRQGISQQERLQLSSKQTFTNSHLSIQPRRYYKVSEKQSVPLGIQVQRNCVLKEQLWEMEGQVDRNSYITSGEL